MHKEIFKKNKAFSILEIVISGAVFVVVMTAVGYLMKEAMFASRKSVESVKAMGLAKEGIAAIENLRISNFSSLNSGTYGLVLSDSTWSLTGNYDIVDDFKRSVTIRSINSRTKLVTVKVAWEDVNTQSKEVVLNSYVTAWTAAGQASYVFFNYQNVYHSGKYLEGLRFNNYSQSSVVIDRVTVYFNDNNKLRYLYIRGLSRLSSKVVSGTEINITNTTIYANTDNTLRLGFTNNMKSDNVKIVFKMSDGSVVESPWFYVN